jgi:hypothetical protein
LEKDERDLPPSIKITIPNEIDNMIERIKILPCRDLKPIIRYVIKNDIKTLERYLDEDV